MKDEADVKQADMVGWYDPGQLFDTGLKTAISTIVGEYADPRLGATDPTNGKFFDYSRQLQDVSDLTPEEIRDIHAAHSSEPEEGADGKQHDDFMPIRGKARNSIWIDYAADVGDGWNSTYAVAYNLGKPTLPAGETTTERGEILIFGGDGVYPTANSDEYGVRLVEPYRQAALAGGIIQSSQTAENSGSPEKSNVDLKQEPHIFVLPGNHDWYDSLTAFKRLFCSKIFNERKFAGAWRTRQKRSYFTIKLPHNWWLLGVDMQLSHNIDLVQLEYFESIAELMRSGDKIILCVPEPYWVKSLKYEEFHVKLLEQKEQSVQRLEEFFEKKGAKIKAYIAGDLHHYRRFAVADKEFEDKVLKSKDKKIDFQDKEKVQKITAGGGGAFLHPTHDFKYPDHFIKNKKDNDIRLEKAFPGYEESKALDKGNLRFRSTNPRFGLVTMLVYSIIAWLINGKISSGGVSQEWYWRLIWDPLRVTANRFIDEPLAAIVIVLLVAGVIAFTDSNSPRYKFWGALAHSAAHLGAIFVLGWLAYFASAWLDNYCPSRFESCSNMLWFVLVLIIPAIGGYFIGPVIMGLYLYISLHRFGRHDNEAFSALKIEDYKNFLRLHINDEGKLTIYPYKIETVPKKWKKSENGKFLIPDDENYTGAELIEKVE